MDTGCKPAIDPYDPVEMENETCMLRKMQLRIHQIK